MSASRVERFLTQIVRWRLAVIALGFLAVVLAGIAATFLRKDTSGDAFLDPNSPALRYRAQVEETFGLKDPIIVAVRHRGPNGIFNPETLRLVAHLTTELAKLPNVDPDVIASLATERSIGATADGMRVATLLDPAKLDAGAIEQLRTALMEMPLYDGILVSRDRTATLIAVELVDDHASADTYEHVLSLVEKTPHAGNEIFVSGEGAIGGYMSTYIDRDAHRLVPIAALVIALVLFAAFFTPRGVIVPMLVVLATLTGTLGLMAITDVAYFTITNGMAVALIGIAVADAIHVFSEYYTQMRLRPELTRERLIVVALTNVWQPIGLTSITTAAGFFSLWLTNVMPPIRYFGLFGAVGVGFAWIFTVTVLPAIIACLSLRQSRYFRSAVARDDLVKRAVLKLGGLVIASPRTVLAIVCAILLVGGIGAHRLSMDYERIGNFNAHESLYKSDRAINETFAGTYHLDVVIESTGAGGVLVPQVLRQIEGLESYLRQLPQVGATSSIVDYIKQMNLALNDGEPASYAIPDDSALVEQMFLAYEVASDPTDFETLLDTGHRTALVRAYLHTGQWSEQRPVVEAVNRYLSEHFNTPNTRATATGRVVVDDAWMHGVADGHFASVAASIFAVFFMCACLFRSVQKGMLALVPDVVATFGVYAVMGFAGIWLGVATSMFASIAIGLGIDFAVHTLDRMKVAARTSSDVDQNLLSVYHSAGRALVFNALAVAGGFGVVMLSSVPPIRLFGALVAAGIASAYFASLTALPALLKLLDRRTLSRAPALETKVAALFLVSIAITFLAPHASAQSGQLTADDIMAKVTGRPDSPQVERTVRIQLIDKRGGIREQVTRAFRKTLPDSRRTAIFYLEPANVRGTAFLTFDYDAAATEDDQWLYLPALRKVRRVPAAERGDYFLGTDLTYEEVRNDNRVTLSDWTFHLVGDAVVDGVACKVVEGTAAAPEIARELGFSRARWHVDPSIWMSRRNEYWDQSGNALKTIDNRELRQQDGVWTPMRVQALNHKTGHRTVLEVTDIDLKTPLADRLFTQQQLVHGL